MSQTFNRSPAITTEVLKSKCPHGLIEDHPVSNHEMATQWNRGNIYNKAIKTDKWRPSWIFNVICQHINCVNTQSWTDRINYKSFRSGHWNRNHQYDKNIRLKVVSHWKTTQNDDNVTCNTEYRLVSIDELKYIEPIRRSDDDIQTHVVDTNQHRSDVSDDDNAHSNISDADDTDTGDQYGFEDDDLNHNQNANKRKLSASRNPKPKRRKLNENDSFAPHQSLARELRKSMKEIRHAVKEMHATQTAMRDAQKQLQETQNEIKEMVIEFKNYRRKYFEPKQEARDNLLINNEMNINLKDIQSANLKEYVSNEGKNIWSLQEAKDDAHFILKCKICDACTDILDNQENDEKREESKRAENERRPPKKVHFVRGQLVSNQNVECHSFFIQKWKSMKQHCLTNKRHIAALKIMNKDINLCAKNIMVKSEVAYQIFSRSEPDILFQKLLTMLHR